MDIKSSTDSLQHITYNTEAYDRLLHQLRDELQQKPYHLCLLLGGGETRKENAIDQLADHSDKNIHEIDANDIITKAESETYENLDALFRTLDVENDLLYLKNGSRLCGVYTGYTHSKVKYASPQERYFLKKIQEFGGLYVIAIDDPNNADTTLRRAAQSVVTIPAPQSIFRKIRNIFQRQKTVHGYEIPNDRPDRYQSRSPKF